MSDATVADIRKAIGQTRLENASSTISSSFIQQKLDAATAEIDSRLVNWYDIPVDLSALSVSQLAAVNALLYFWCISIAVYQIMTLSSADVPIGIKENYDRAQARLKEVQGGTYAIPYVLARTRYAVKIVGNNQNVLDPAFFSKARRLS